MQNQIGYLYAEWLRSVKLEHATTSWDFYQASYYARSPQPQFGMTQ